MDNKGLMQQFNRQSEFNIDTSTFRWVRSRDLFEADPEAKHKVLGLFVSKGGKFGPEPVAIVEGALVNLPHHLVDSIQQMLANDDVVQYIKAGHVAFKIYKYYSSRYNTDGYSIEWLDI